jgi:hypothetical protein
MGHRGSGGDHRITCDQLKNVRLDGAVRLHYGFNTAGPSLKKVVTIVGCVVGRIEDRSPSVRGV